MDAPAVFGFAESMAGFCNQRAGKGWVVGGPGGACHAAGLNILRIGEWDMVRFSSVKRDAMIAYRVKPYVPIRISGCGQCQNVEWMTCAVKGRLAFPWKEKGANPNGGEIIFSLAPKDLDLHPFNQGTYPRCCGDYAENDIYYLEVCVLSEMCANSDEMWRLNVGDTFRCELSETKWRSMRQALLKFS